LQWAEDMSIDIWYVDRQIMPPSPGHSARVRSEIFQHAARLFRLRGYAGTNIDDIMLAAGLTRGAFYAHFKSKDDLFAEVIGAGHGLLVRMRAGGKVRDVLDGYLAKDAFTATLRDCTLASLAGDVARAPLAAQLAYANVLHGLIGEMARGRGRKLDADATAAVILAVGGLGLAQASGDRRLSDWLLRCARRAVRSLLAPKKKPNRRASPKRKRSPSRRKAAAARRPRRAARSRDGRA
jgi:TetR/AcrR family transcriptional repressor of nem operon